MCSQCDEGIIPLDHYVCFIHLYDENGDFIAKMIGGLDTERGLYDEPENVERDKYRWRLVFQQPMFMGGSKSDTDKRQDMDNLSKAKTATMQIRLMGDDSKQYVSEFKKNNEKFYWEPA